MRLEQIVLDDQKRIRGLFRQVQVLEQRAPEMIRGVVAELYLDLRLHAYAVLDRILPSLMVISDPAVRGSLDQVRQAETEILAGLEALEPVSPDAENWERWVADFRRTVDLHFDYELRELLPEIAKMSADQAKELSSRILDQRHEIAARPEHAQARAFLAQNPRGGEQKRRVG